MAADRAKQKCGPQVLRTWHDVGSAAAFAGSPEHGPFQGSPRGASGTAYLTMDPLSRPLALVTRSVHLRRFWQCSTCLSHSPSSVQCTFGPPRRVSSSLLVTSHLLKVFHKTLTCSQTVLNIIYCLCIGFVRHSMLRVITVIQLSLPHL
uniref:Uncharacterized protein n=1 Tax=Ursus maritimus TaxID=29073 RepID=A0A452UFI3_URSMA